jgi:hypothetical protein
MTKRVIQQSRIRIPGKTVVRNDMGIPIQCCWDDCENPGYDEIKIVVNEPKKKLHYIFCSDRHKRFHITGHRTYGKLDR